MGKKKGPPPLTKRYNNGHKCLTASESVAIIECQNRVDRARDNFFSNVHTMSQARNCTLGEATSRDNAPPLIAHDRLPFRPGEEPYDILAGTLSAKTYNNPDVAPGVHRQTTSDILRVTTLRKRSGEIDNELAMVREALRHKQFVLNLSHNGSRLPKKTLHTAMEQKIAERNISIPYIG